MPTRRPPVVVPAVGQRNRQLIESLNQHIAQLDAELLALVKVEPESETQAPTEEHGEPTDELEDRWKASIALLLTIPGIGLLTGGFLVVVTLNFTLCESAEAAAQFVGQAPVLHSRGTSLRGQGTTSEYDFRDMPFCLLGVYTGRRSRRKARSHIARLIREQQVRSGHRQWEVARSLPPMSTMKERLAS